MMKSRKILQRIKDLSLRIIGVHILNQLKTLTKITILLKDTQFKILLIKNSSIRGITEILMDQIKVLLQSKSQRTSNLIHYQELLGSYLLKS
jgi:hypothetical protein